MVRRISRTCSRLHIVVATKIAETPGGHKSSDP